MTPKGPLHAKTARQQHLVQYVLPVGVHLSYGTGAHHHHHHHHRHHNLAQHVLPVGLLLSYGTGAHIFLILAPLRISNRC